MQKRFALAIVMLLLGVASWDLFLDGGAPAQSGQVRTMDDPTDTPTPKP